MPAFEYQTNVLTHGFMGRSKGEVRRKDLDADLNAMGAQGWELSHLYMNVEIERGKDGHLVIYKRQIQAQPGI